MPLSGNQRRYLRSLGHHLKPIVQVGHQGVTEAVVKQLAGALRDHELVKVKLAEAVKDRPAAATALLTGTESDWVQSLGRTLLFYKPRDKKPEIVLPKPHSAPITRLPKPLKKNAEGEDVEETDDDADDDAEDE